jgi:hypothetical protein
VIAVAAAIGSDDETTTPREMAAARPCYVAAASTCSGLGRKQGYIYGYLVH